MIPLGAFLAVSLALFALGLAGLLARRDLLRAALALQLAFAGAALAFAAFARWGGAASAGRDLAWPVVLLAGVEALALAAFVAARSRTKADGPGAGSSERGPAD